LSKKDREQQESSTKSELRSQMVDMVAFADVARERTRRCLKCGVGRVMGGVGGVGGGGGAGGRGGGRGGGGGGAAAGQNTHYNRFFGEAKPRPFRQARLRDIWRMYSVDNADPL
jgi:hypothetical protein